MDLSPPRGTEDLLPPVSGVMGELYRRAFAAARLFGYRYVETPGFEATELFARTSGETSDVVSKEMYTFLDRSERSLTLRPEGTAPVVRAYLAHSDAGLSRVDLQVNSIGDENCRPAYRQALVEYLESQVSRLRDEHRDRFRDNPLRVLDCKDPACREVALDAPRITDHLDAACKEHFDAVLAGLEEEGIAATVESTLVRGLDYYTRTAFEFVHRDLSPSQSTVCGGGRYDGLAEVLGGPPTPGVGFGMGLDRVVLALQAEGVELDTPPPLDVFVVAFGPGAEPRGREVVRVLRASGVAAEGALEERPLKAQLKMADRAGARFAVIVGEREAEAGEATVRRMKDGTQQTVPLTDVATWIAAQQDAAEPPA